MAGIGQARLLDDRQGVHVGADQQRGTGAVLQDSDDPESAAAVGIDADVVGDGVTRGAQFAGEDGGGLFLEVGELRMSVDRLVDRDQGTGAWPAAATGDAAKARAPRAARQGKFSIETRPPTVRRPQTLPMGR